MPTRPALCRPCESRSCSSPDERRGLPAGCLDLIEKAQEFLAPVPPIAAADGNPAGHVQSRKQRGDSMALVIVGLPRRHAGRQRQDGLGAVQQLSRRSLGSRDRGPIKAHCASVHNANRRMLTLPVTQT